MHINGDILYIVYIYHFQLGFITALPYLLFWLCVTAGGWLADVIRIKRWLSTLNTRRLMMVTGEVDWTWLTTNFNRIAFDLSNLYLWTITFSCCSLRLPGGLPGIEWLLPMWPGGASGYIAHSRRRIKWLPICRLYDKLVNNYWSILSSPLLGFSIKLLTISSLLVSI